MIHIADVKMPGALLHLGMAAQAKIRIAHRQHFGVDGAVRIMTSRATFAHGGMFKNDRLGLFPMALGATLVLASHREAPGRFHDIHAVRVVTLDTIHFALNDKMVLGQVKFRLGIRMALETGGRVLAGIDDEFPAAVACRNMFAARAVAGFAAGLAGPLRAGQMQSRVGTRRKGAGDVVVAIRADFVAHKRRAFNLQRRHRRPVHGGT